MTCTSLTSHATTQELLASCPHHNDKARRRALQGLLSLFTRYPSELTANLSDVLATLAARVADPDAAARSALLALWDEGVAPHVSEPQLAPFVPLLMAHTTAAATDLAVDVRLDALRFLERLMAACPRVAAARYAGVLLRLFAGAVAPDQRARTLKARSLATLAATITHLRHVLTGLLTEQHDGSADTPGSESADADPSTAALGRAAVSAAQPTAGEMASIEALSARACGSVLLPGMPGSRLGAYVSSGVRHCLHHQDNHKLPRNLAYFSTALSSRWKHRSLCAIALLIAYQVSNGAAPCRWPARQQGGAPAHPPQRHRRRQRSCCRICSTRGARGRQGSFAHSRTLWA